MNMLVSGASGLIGSALVGRLKTEGHSILRLVRKPPVSPDQIQWDPIGASIDAEKLGGLDAVVHLAGDPIASGRWTPRKKARIRESRVRGTEFLAKTLSSLSQPPKTFLCASAIGIYGERGDEILREESPPGRGFLAQVGHAWEKATQPLQENGIRVVHLRFGIVLHPDGGALAKMLPPFRLGVGGPLGNGRQFMSWISREDAIGAILHAAGHRTLVGPLNVVAPQPIRNLEFTRTLGNLLSRPAILPVPPVALRILFGEMADEALLASTRVEPAKLLATGYTFRHPDLESALRAVLGS